MNREKKCIKKILLFLAVIWLSAPLFSQTVNIYWDQLGQEIDGFGASAAFRQADNLKKFPTAEREKILDLLFSRTEGIGLSIVRNMVGDGSMSEWGNDIDGPTDTIEPQNGVWNLDAQDEQIWFMHEAAARGCEIFMSTVWSPPRWMKTNNSCINGGSLQTSMYDEYAEYLSRYVNDYMRDRNNIEIYAISVSNEPDMSVGYSSCLWSGEQFRTFVKNYLGPKFDQDNVGAKIMIGESSQWTEEPARATLSDSQAAAYLDIVAGHNYGNSNYPAFTTARSMGKRVWETEVSNLDQNDSSMTDGLRWATQIHNFMTNAKGNAWLYWWTICYKVNPAKGESLININTTNNTWFTNKRLFTMGNYSRFVRPGWNRIETSTSSSNNVQISAYKDSNSGDFAVVVINNNWNSQNFTFSIDGTSVDSVTPYITSSTKDLEEQTPVTSSNGAFTYSLPANSVTTFYRGSTQNENLGDVNGDGQITITDALMIAQYSVGGNPTGFITANGDVNNDGVINIVDALKVAQYYVGLISEF